MNKLLVVAILALIVLQTSFARGPGGDMMFEIEVTAAVAK